MSRAAVGTSYDPSPAAARTFIGFNYTWWLVIFVVFMLLLMSVGHGGWGY